VGEIFASENVSTRKAALTASSIFLLSAFFYSTAVCCRRPPFAQLPTPSLKKDGSFIISGDARIFDKKALIMSIWGSAFFSILGCNNSGTVLLAEQFLLQVCHPSLLVLPYALVPTTFLFPICNSSGPHGIYSMHCAEDRVASSQISTGL
jgi:hypothetical protein